MGRSHHDQVRLVLMDAPAAREFGRVAGCNGQRETRGPKAPVSATGIARCCRRGTAIP